MSDIAFAEASTIIRVRGRFGKDPHMRVCWNNFPPFIWVDFCVIFGEIVKEASYSTPVQDFYSFVKRAFWPSKFGKMGHCRPVFPIYNGRFHV